MQKHIEDSNPEDEPYSIRQLRRKLSERYGAEGSDVRLTQRARLPKIMLLQEEADDIVTDTILDSSIGIAAKIIKNNLDIDQQKKQQTKVDDVFYSYPNDLTYENLTAQVPAPLKDFLDTVYSKSRTKTAKKKKQLRKIAVAHALMQFCKHERVFISTSLGNWTVCPQSIEITALGGCIMFTWVLSFILGGVKIRKVRCYIQYKI